MEKATGNTTTLPKALQDAYRSINSYKRSDRQTISAHLARPILLVSFPGHTVHAEFQLIAFHVFIESIATWRSNRHCSNWLSPLIIALITYAKYKKENSWILSQSIDNIFWGALSLWSFPTTSFLPYFLSPSLPSLGSLSSCFVTLCCDSCDLFHLPQVNLQPLWIPTGRTPASDSLLVMIVFIVQTCIACTGDPSSA